MLSRLQRSQRPELPRAALGIAAPDVIAGQVEVPYRRAVLRTIKTISLG